MADLHFLANPARFRRFSQRVLPGLGFATVLMLCVGLYMAFFVAPADYQQGQTVRIMFLHVPSAWLSMMGYALLAGLGASLLVWRHPLAALMARAAAPVGASFAAVCLLTGSLWGRPMWGTYWVWDARLTSMLLLFFLYLGHIALSRAYDEPERGDRAAAILALIGVINLPIIKFSVDWWNTLHQPASVTRLDAPAIHNSILVPLLWMAVSLLFLFRDRPSASRECRRAGRGGPGMSNHAAFILASYLAAFVILGGLVIASLSARNRVRRELDQRGLAPRGSAPRGVDRKR